MNIDELVVEAIAYWFICIKVAIADLLEYLEPVPLLTQEYQKAIALMTTLKLGGGGIFDAVIAQAALKVEADCILTLNPKDFTRLGDEIAVLVQMPEWRMSAIALPDDSVDLLEVLWKSKAIAPICR